MMMVRRRRFHSQKVQMPKLRELAGDTRPLSRRRYQHRRRRLKRPTPLPPKTRNLFLCGGMERCFLRWPTPGIEGRCGTLAPKVCDTRSRRMRSEEHTSELQSLTNLVCRLLLGKKKIHL